MRTLNFLKLAENRKNTAKTRKKSVKLSKTEKIWKKKEIKSRNNSKKKKIRAKESLQISGRILKCSYYQRGGDSNDVLSKTAVFCFIHYHAGWMQLRYCFCNGVQHQFRQRICRFCFG